MRYEKEERGTGTLEKWRQEVYVQEVGKEKWDFRVDGRPEEMEEIVQCC